MCCGRAIDSTELAALNDMAAEQTTATVALMKEMKKSMLDGEDKKEGQMTFGANTLQGYSDMMLADEVSKSGKS